MKKFSIILAVLLVALLLASIPVMSASAAGDKVRVNYFFGATKDNTYGENGFWGPYSENMATLDENYGIVFDLSIQDSWFTTEICPQEMGPYHYAVFDIKTDDITAINGFEMYMGGVRKPWNEWVNYDGYALPVITTDFHLYCVDLYASGVDYVIGDGPDIAMNKAKATGGHLYIKSVTFTNSIPSSAEIGDTVDIGGTPPTPIVNPSKLNMGDYDYDFEDDLEYSYLYGDDTSSTYPDWDDDDYFDYSDDEGVLNPDGSITYEDGTILYPDGSVGLGDGVILTADGKQLIFSDGTIFNSDGKFIKPDGTVIDPGDFEYTDDGLLFENGILITDDGKVIYPDSNNNNSAINKTSIKGKGSDTPNPNTGVERIAIALAVSALALGGLIVSKKVR
jgi:hypothetical protein